MWRKGNDGNVRLFYYLSDGQDSIRQLTDATGGVTDSYHYDAFGKTLNGGSGDTENPFRYTGQQLDSDGRYYLRARFYNSGTGRFLSHDPLMGNEHDPISMHRYLYAADDGVNSVDPTGLYTMTEVSVSMPTSQKVQTSNYGSYSVTYTRAARAFGRGGFQPGTFPSVPPPVGMPPTIPISPWELIPGTVWATGGFGLTGTIGFAAWAVRSYEDRLDAEESNITSDTVDENGKNEVTVYRYTDLKGYNAIRSPVKVDEILYLKFKASQPPKASGNPFGAYFTKDGPDTPTLAAKLGGLPWEKTEYWFKFRIDREKLRVPPMSGRGTFLYSPTDLFVPRTKVETGRRSKK